MRLIKSTPKGKQRVYDIEVADVHNFYANGVNVHNCATNGGVSVINEDNNVIDITAQSGGSYNATSFIAITENNRLIFEQDSSNRAVFCIPIPSADRITATSDGSITDKVVMKYYSAGSHIPYPCYFGAGINNGISLGEGDNQALVGTSGELTILHPNFDYPEQGKVAYATTSYNTGWMHGDIKGAFLSDTNATNVTGSELVTNGTFDTNTTGWNLPFGGGSITSSSGTLRIESNGAYCYVTQSVPVETGKQYFFSVDVVNLGTSTDNYIRVGSAGNDSTNYVNTQANSVGTRSRYFTAVGTTATITLVVGNGATRFATFDNVSIRVTEPDRSVNNNGLQVFGTITKSAVATGAELVAYSEFSTSNYLHQPYNSALDFGTGDFYVMGWVKSSGGSVGYIWERAQTLVASAYTEMYWTNSNTLNFHINGGTPATQSVSPNVWNHFVALRSGGVQSLYVNGIRGTNVTNSGNLTNSNAQFRVGIRAYDVAAPFNGSIALIRVGTTAPSPEQIKKMYEDEKVLFQENAACTLYGSSDAVTALAYDDSTNLLYVGTSSGRSDFQGLRRINNTTTAVTTAMSASNGLVAEQ